MENLNNFLSNLDPENKMLFRQLEKLTYRKIKAINSINFNKNCIREHLCPQGNIFSQAYHNRFRLSFDQIKLYQ